MADKHKLEKIRRGEWDTIKRRRKGLTQAEVATAEGVNRLVVVRREKDSEWHPRKDLAVTGPELCFIWRTRKELTQKRVGDLIGVSSFWVREMEAGRQDHTKLMSFLKKFFM